MKRVVVIGASGLVGNNVLKYLKARGIETIGTYFSYQAEDTVFFNTLDPASENNFSITGFSPDVIVHCGALTHVDYCETHEKESYEKTVISTQNVRTICEEIGAKMVYISTDYVFNGQDGPYSEDAEVDPLSVYGRHKLQAETEVKQVDDWLILRCAKIFGDEERGKNFVARMVESLIGGELKWNAFTDQYTTAINAHDIARAMYHLLKDEKTGIYHMSYGEYFNAFEMVNKIASHFPKAKADIKPITKDDFRQDAMRPVYGGLKNDKFLSEYPEFKFTTLDDYLIKISAP